MQHKQSIWEKFCTSVSTLLIYIDIVNFFFEQIKCLPSCFSSSISESEAVEDNFESDNNDATLIYGKPRQRKS